MPWYTTCRQCIDDFKNFPEFELAEGCNRSPKILTAVDSAEFEAPIESGESLIFEQSPDQTLSYNGLLLSLRTATVTNAF